MTLTGAPQWRYAAAALRRPTLMHDISLCWRIDRRPSPAAHALLQEARAAAERVAS